MDQKIIDLYDHFTHGGMSRRDFLDRLAALAGSTAAASVLVAALQNDYARAETIAETDPRITTETVTIPGGPASLKGYLARPKAEGKHGAVLVIHENRGLNPHIKDVVRRFAADGFIALGLDYLSPAGGTPSDEDKARAMIGDLSPADALAASKAACAYLASVQGGTGKVGAVGFCWGGGQVNRLAVGDPSLSAGVAYYGRQPPAEDVPAIKAPLLLHYGGLDTQINAGIPAFEAALKESSKTYQIFVYDGANHAFNNDTGSRYDPKAAALAWERTVAFLREHLA